MPPALRPRAIAAAFGVYKAIQRQRRTLAARVADQLQTQLQAEHNEAGVRAMALSAAAEAADVRRVVERARGKWRGSTLFGYVRGDGETYRANFHCSKKQFDGLVHMLQGSELDKAENRTQFVRNRGVNVTQRAREHTDPPTLLFKVAACMYALCQEGSIKVKADVGSVGASTLKGWLAAFAAAVRSKIKPVYMSGKPFSEEELAAVRGQFASRRGIQVCALACDGSHIPFHPKNRRVMMDYRNYKGWTSILAVAFVDSYYRFFELDAGYPGRAGDNTVLQHNWLMKELRESPDTWLGPNGLVLGDSGASDGDTVFLNPYHGPSEPDKCWFNFCHSSTRFYVEQTFGIWKSRFRFLLNHMRGANHKLTTQLIHASAILHNYFIVNSDDATSVLDTNTGNPSWITFFNNFKAMSCPSCKARNAPHCIHQATFRNGPGVRSAREAPSEVRESLREELWARVVADPDGDDVRQVMGERAVAGFASQ